MHTADSSKSRENPVPSLPATQLNLANSLIAKIPGQIPLCPVVLLVSQEKNGPFWTSQKHLLHAFMPGLAPKLSSLRAETKTPLWHYRT